MCAWLVDVSDAKSIGCSTAAATLFAPADDTFGWRGSINAWASASESSWANN